MFRTALRVLAVLGAALAIGAGPAAAHTRRLAPPGNSAISQYVEVIPTAGGGQPTSGIHSGGGAAQHSAGAIPAATARVLDSHGSLGAADAGIARATAPPAGRSRRARGSSPTARPAAATPAAPAPAASVFGALTGSSGTGGLGALLPVVLIMCLLGGGLVALLRRRRAS